MIGDARLFCRWTLLVDVLATLALFAALSGFLGLLAGLFLVCRLLLGIGLFRILSGARVVLSHLLQDSSLRRLNAGGGATPLVCRSTMTKLYFGSLDAR